MIYVKNYVNIIKSIMQDKKLHVTAKAIYAYMISFTDSSQCCFHTRPEIVYNLGINDKTLRKYLKQLAENGYIKVLRRKEKDSYRNVYEILDLKIKY